jgi:hypothetical protein
LTGVYVATFLAGIGLLTASMIPLWGIPEPDEPPAAWRVGEWRRLREAFQDPSLRNLLIHGWWLALANGLTQSAFFGYLYGPLAIGLGTVSLLNNVRHAVGIPVSWATGVIADRDGNKRLMIAGVLVAGSSLFFWLRADAGQWWWLIGAYACWGAFPAVNITGRNLVLKLSPAGDNTTPMALFRQVGGMLAGLSGLVGGIWLDRLNAAGFTLELGSWRLGPYQVLFAVSLAGRLSAALWLLGVREPRVNVTGHVGWDQRA